METSRTTRRRKHLQRLGLFALGIFVLILLAVAVIGRTGPGVSQDALLKEIKKQASTDTIPTPVPSIKPTSISRKQPLPNDLSIRWLSDFSCHPPCWGSITPGITSASIAQDTLAKNPIIGSVDIGISRLTPDDGELNWTWANGADGGWAVFHAQMITQPISMISPAFPAPISLRELIEAYGNPSHVIASAYHGPDIGSGIFYDLSVIYAPLGIRLHPGGTFKPVLSDDMLFNDVNFYDPADKQGLEPQAMLVPWQGIRKFDFYCRDHEEGYACRGN